MKPRAGCEPCSPSPIPHFVPQATARPEEAADLCWSEQQTQQFPVCGHRQFGHCNPPASPARVGREPLPAPPQMGSASRCGTAASPPPSRAAVRTKNKRSRQRGSHGENRLFHFVFNFLGRLPKTHRRLGREHASPGAASIRTAPSSPRRQVLLLAALTPTKRTLCQLQPRDPLRAYAGASWSQGLMYSTQPACVLRLPATCVFHFCAVTNVLFQGQGLGVEISTTC